MQLGKGKGASLPPDQMQEGICVCVAPGGAFSSLKWGSIILLCCFSPHPSLIHAGSCCPTASHLPALQPCPQACPLSQQLDLEVQQQQRNKQMHERGTDAEHHFMKCKQDISLVSVSQISA